MALREFLLPWDSQPQEVTGVDWGNSINQGLSGLWNLGVTESGNGLPSNDLTLPSTLVTRTATSEGLALDFATSNTGATFANTSAVNAATSKTVIARIRLRSYGGGSRGRIFDNTNSGNGFLFYVDDSGFGTGKSLTFSPNNGTITYSTANSVLLDTWYTVAVVYDIVALTAAYFVNGQQVGSGSSLATMVASANPGRIGARSDATRSFDGQISYLSIWNRALSAAEVATASNAIWSAFAPRSIWVPVSAGAGGSATDLTIQEATHSHTADSLTITVASTLAIQDAAHAQTADNLALTLGYVDLVIADATHAHTADNLTLSVSGATDLTIQDATHGQTADSPTLTLGYVDLTIDEALHAHAADNVTLGGLYTDLELILKILSNRQELNAGTGTFTIYDDDSVSVLFTTSAWADAAGTVPYSGGTLGRIDALA